MCDSSSSDEEEDDLPETKTVVVPVEPDKANDKVERQPRKRASAASAGIRDALADVNEDDLPELSPAPEVTMAAEDGFGASISSKTLDTDSIRSIVNSQNDVTGSICTPADDMEITESATSQSAETDDTAEINASQVDPKISDLDMLLLGFKKTSRDKFYDLHTAMRSMNATFLKASLKTTDGEVIRPAKIELHRLVFSKQDDVRTMIEEMFSHPNGMVELTQKCWQVLRKKHVEGGEDIIEVCLYLRIDPVIVKGLAGELAACERYTELCIQKSSEEAGQVIAIDKKTVEKIAKCNEANVLLHELVKRSVSGKRKLGKNSPTYYAKFDELPTGDNKEEHESFAFKLVEAKTVVKRAPKTPSTVVCSKTPSTVVCSKTPSTVVETTTTTTTPAPPPKPNSVVLHNSEKDDPTKNADDEQKEKWESVGAALNANEGVVKPAQPWAPTMLQLDMPFEKLQVVRGGDGKPILMVYP